MFQDVSSRSSHWLFLSYCLFWFLNFRSRSMDPSCRHHSRQDPNEIPEKSLCWIERSRLFCYSVIKFRFVASFSQKLYYSITLFSLCQELFYFSLPSFSQATCTLYHTLDKCQEKICNHQIDNCKSGEEGIWTLAPLLTTYSLSRRAPSASWVLLHRDACEIFCFRKQLINITIIFYICQ